MEHHPQNSEDLSSSQIDYEALHSEALEHNHDSFAQRIEKIAESDPELASDLRLTLRLAEAMVAAGGVALVVGGFARDEALSRITGRPVESKDIDVEVYGVEFERVKEIIQELGTVNVVGDHFAVAKLKKEETGHDLDISIPRRDSKTDVGHRGFLVTGDPCMSVREAARRRDLTINSLAMNPRTGELIDEYGGLEDLKRGILRATDPELFPDDPLRVLRVMQFAARFEFEVDPATAELCRGIDLTELPKERIGEEWNKLMLKSNRPSVGLEVARNLGVLKQLHPDLEILNTIEQEPDWHPEGNVWNHTKNATDAAARVIREERLSSEDALVVMYGALCHDLGKATTTELKEKNGVMRLTAHKHDIKGVEPTKRFLEQLGQPNRVVEKITPVVREHLFHVGQPNPSDKVLNNFAQRLNPSSIRLYDLISRCDSNGRGLEWQVETPSHALYLRATELGMGEKPVARLIEGHNLAVLGIEGGEFMGVAVGELYDAQVDGKFTDIEGGLAYYREHEAQMHKAAAARVEQRRVQAAKAKIEQDKLERRAKKQQDHLDRIAANKSLRPKA